MVPTFTRKRSRQYRYYVCLNWKTISLAAGMTFWNFYFQIFDKAVGKEETIIFLTHLLRYLKSPLVVIWDRLPAHRIDSRFWVF